jgi:hypothetical protein
MIQAQWLTPVLLAIQKAEMKRITFEASPGKKFRRPHFNQWLDVVM